MSEAPDPQPLSQPRWTLVAVGIGTFMSALDSSVVNTVLPVLRDAFHASVAGVEWVTTVYLLVVSGLLLSVGRAGDLHGHKRTYVAGFGLFVLGSALCAAAPNAAALVALRGLQGIGAAMLFANAPAILTKAFPTAQRGRALGALGTFTYLGLTVGPSLGGWLAGRFGWRWVFLINLPVGALAIALALRFVADDRPERRGEPFDRAGAALFTVGLVALLVALDQGHAWGWTSPAVLALAAVAAAALVVFGRVERRTAAPMLDLALFRSRVFTAATASAILNYVAVFGALFSLPFLLIQGRGMAPSQAGMLLTAQPLVMAVTSPWSGALSDRIGSRLLASGGMLLLALGLAVLALVAPAGSRLAIAAALGTIGLGVGLFVSPNNSALMGAAPRHRQGIAAGVLATARNVGMVLGVGVAGAVVTTVLARAGGGTEALPAAVRAALAASAGFALVGAVTSWQR